MRMKRTKTYARAVVHAFFFSSFKVGVSFREALRAARQERDLAFTISGGDAARAVTVLAPFRT
jgi:homoserine dehydrogenase